MDFIDYRKTPAKQTAQETQRVKENKYHGRRFLDYVGEQIREAQERGEFNKLPGFGKPLNLGNDYYAGDKALGYHLLKSNGYAPFEIELSREIDSELKRVEARLARVRQQGKSLRTRRVPPFPSEKRAFNAAVEKATSEYTGTLQELNRKILTLNVSAPPIMHKSLFDVEKLVQDFRAANPLFER